MKLIFLILIFSIHLFSQTDNKKWSKADFSYQLKSPDHKRDYSLKGNAGEIILKSLVNVYWFAVSDVDGDNCSFSPSCSEFFVEGIKRTNIFTGILMFADRFTRDLNPFKVNNYPLTKNNQFFDPVYLYDFNSDILSYISPESVVNTE